MDITVYLPDDIGKWAKEAELPLSRLLRGVVLDEKAKQEAVMTTLEDVKTYEVDIETPEGAVITGRITGREIGYDRNTENAAYLTNDERVLIYDASRRQVEDVSDDSAAALTDFFANSDADAYVEAMEAIGEKAVIDL